VKTLKADKYQRVRIPDAKPLQVFSYTNNGNGSFTLTVLKEDVKPRFPKGSLLKYFSGELGRKRDAEETAIASGCLQGPP
jgi:hypothetical protein